MPNYRRTKKDLLVNSLNNSSEPTMLSIPDPESGPLKEPRASRGISFTLSNFTGLALIIVFIAIYAGIEPSVFLTWSNLRLVLSAQVITGFLTLGLLFSLIAGVFDLSIGANMSWAVVFFGWLEANTDMNAALAVVIVLISGVLIGLCNAVIITRLNVDSVIATLAMQSILLGLTYWISGGEDITQGFTPDFLRLGNGSLFTIPLPVYYLVGVALIIYYVLEQTPAGRYLYATGGNTVAARLAGMRTARIQTYALLASGGMASLAGLLFTAQIGTASFDAGTPYLLPAFTAAFLGATQIKPGRFNVAGTVIAIYLLAVGLSGLSLKFPSAPWIQDVFEGAVLIVAVTASIRSARRAARRRA
jgi:ribose transport system permease protein